MVKCLLTDHNSIEMKVFKNLNMLCCSMAGAEEVSERTQCLQVNKVNDGGMVLTSALALLLALRSDPNRKTLSQLSAVSALCTLHF